MKYQIKNIFMEKSSENMQEKLVPDFYVILVINPK